MKSLSPVVLRRLTTQIRSDHILADWCSDMEPVFQ